ncbi:MAG: hypothetical protein LBC61_04780 [Candidatus Peribacteria bacterium]|jgi:hypothetical protein|nr:hypothetical protein [Candidatus Peribacteria bacterium]
MSKEMDIYAFIQNPESIPEYIAKTIEYVKKLHNIKTFDSVDNFDEIISTFNNANNDNIEKNRLKILDLFRVGWVTKGNSEVVKTDLQKDLLKEQEFAKIREFLSSPENF